MSCIKHPFTYIYFLHQDISLLRFFYFTFTSRHFVTFRFPQTVKASRTWKGYANFASDICCDLSVLIPHRYESCIDCDDCTEIVTAFYRPPHPFPNSLSISVRLHYSIPSMFSSLSPHRRTDLATYIMMRCRNQPCDYRPLCPAYVWITEMVDDFEDFEDK